MTVPAMDRPSVAFARFLDSVIVVPADDAAATPMLTCTLCGGDICLVEEHDTLRVLLNTALAHVCEG